METCVAKQRGYCALYMECFKLVRLHALRTVVTAELWNHKYMVLKPRMSWSHPNRRRVFVWLWHWDTLSSARAPQVLLSLAWELSPCRETSASSPQIPVAQGDSWVRENISPLLFYESFLGFFPGLTESHKSPVPSQGGCASQEHLREWKTLCQKHKKNQVEKDHD